MYQIKTLNKISANGLELLPTDRFVAGDSAENEDGILVRSAKMHDYVFPENLRAIARAGAGTNNIPIDRCSEAGIAVFSTPGANANAVKELVLWGDCCVANFFINREALKKRDFSRVCYNWDCC